MTRSVRLAATVLALLACQTAPAQDPKVEVKHRVPPTSANTCGIDTLYVCFGCLAVPPPDGDLVGLEARLPLESGGLSLEQLSAECRSRGVSAWAIRTDLETLLSYNNPAVLHVSETHYIALLGRDGDRILVFDTAVGLIRCTREWFAGRYEWKGTALILGSTPPGLLVRAYGPPVALIAVGVAVLGWIARSVVRRGQPRAERR